jgi:sugar phosphate isomerase/epimerase
MLQLAYNSNGWRRFPLPETIAQLAQIGYSAVEVSCQPAHLKPFDWHDSDVQTIKRALADQSMTISNVHTGVKHLLSMQDYEPSLITSDGAGRKRRIDFLRACIDLTSALDVPFLAINTGFIRPEVPVAQAWAYLVAGMEECLEYAQRSNVRLLVEPEPEMFIETVRDFLALYEKMNRPPALGLNLDVGHAQWGYEDTPAIIRELSELI